MARRKQHQARKRERTGATSGTAQARRPVEGELPPPNPPKRSVPLLVFSIGLFLIWLIVLIVLAVNV